MNSVSKKAAKRHKLIIEELKEQAKEDELWNETNLVAKVTEIFIDLQKAWSEQNLNFIETKITPNLYKSWKKTIEEMNERNESNVVSNITVQNISFVETNLAWKKFTVYIVADVKDVTIDLATGSKIKDQSGKFSEFWSFVWQKDQWILNEIDQEINSKKFIP